LAVELIPGPFQFTPRKINARATPNNINGAHILLFLMDCEKHGFIALIHLSFVHGIVE
jgi:hypothetical protein